MTDYGVVLFPTTSSVMQAEKALKKQGLEVKLIPVPRQFSSDCGISLRFSWSNIDKVRTTIEAARIDIQSIHRIPE
jgi:hypothetical protein